MEQKTYQFHIRGMHCKSCVLLTESELKEFPYISEVKASLKSNLVLVKGYFGDKTSLQVAKELSLVLKPHGYTLAVENDDKTKQGDVNWGEFKIAIPITILFVTFYIFLQKIGLVDFFNVKEISYGTAFIVGIIASLSSCMAVVGGLLLSMSASLAKEGGRLKSQILFHVGRIISFFILGGVIGALGSVFQLSGMSMFILSLIIALVMLILGINLLGVFHSAKRFQLGMPKFLSKHALSISKLNYTFTPLLVGVFTFFLPCGFTQTMQIYTLSTASFLEGAFLMLSFALGTFPVLALISFGSMSIVKNKRASIFFKVAGLIVILFAIFNLINALVVINVLPPIFNF